jgi:hypothetical protein
MITTIDVVREATASYNHGGWPWSVAGIFGVEDDLALHGEWSDFCYTVGAYENRFECEFWMPCFSVEGRYMGNEMTGGILNYLVGGVIVGALGPGDDVRVPLGIPKPDGEWDHDADAIFWVGEPLIDVDNRYATNMTPITTILPIRWSSPLGWRD